MKVAAVAIACALLVAGCGSASKGASTTAPPAETTPTTAPVETEADQSAGCLSPDEVEKQVDDIAAGAEASQAEVEAKQEAIRQVRERAC
jgi:hypothetical protein